MGVAFRKEARSLLRRWLFALGMLLLSLEILARFAPPGLLPALGGDDYLAAEYDSELGWFLKPGTRQLAVASREIWVDHNSLGFRNDELQPKTKPRIMFLGDSFVWGFDVTEEERFTNILQERFAKWDIFNAGVIGYGTDQELLLLTRFYDIIQPDLVVLIYAGINDPLNNSTNYNYGLFKPYFAKENGQLILQGVPVKQSLMFDFRRYNSLFRYSYLLRGIAGVVAAKQSGVIRCDDLSWDLILAMERLVVERGGKFIVGYESISPELLHSLEIFGVRVINLVTDLRLEGWGGHWTPAGQRWVADTISEKFKEWDLIDPEQKLWRADVK